MMLAVLAIPVQLLELLKVYGMYHILMKTQMVKKAQASDTIYHTIREAIAVGLLPMGTRLREEEIAEVFDVSRTPVREAMKQLEMFPWAESFDSGNLYYAVNPSSGHTHATVYAMVYNSLQHFFGE